MRFPGSSGQKLDQPFGLSALKGIETSKILASGRSLIDCCTNESWRPQRSDIDSFFLENMTKMLNDRLCLKLDREQAQKKDLQKWISEEQVRRYLKREREEIEAEQQRRRLEQMYKEQRQQLYSQSNTAPLTQVELLTDCPYLNKYCIRGLINSAIISMLTFCPRT